MAVNKGFMFLAEIFSYAVQLRQAARRARYRYAIETRYLERLNKIQEEGEDQNPRGLHAAECPTCGYLAAPPFIGEACPECSSVLGEAWLK